MTLEDLKLEYDRLQFQYGDPSLHSIYFGGCNHRPRILFVFMNPTGRNIASYKDWTGPHYPWIGTKNIWDLFYKVALMDKDIYDKIKSIKGKDWTVEFTEEVYRNVNKYGYFISNLGKCTQVDARPLPDSVYQEYLHFLYEEIKIVEPEVVVLFGNQVSSIVLQEKISVSTVRKKKFEREIDGKRFKFYSVFYPVGNGRFNIDKSIEDVKWILENETEGCDNGLSKKFQSID